jgi:predicted enzyme related to lactoylglutathione lyase
MSKRDDYEHGVPCGIAGAYPSPDDAARFYGELFGWEAEEIGDGHLICRLRGRDAAMIGTAPDPAAPEAALWITHIQVDDAGDAAHKASAAGGTILAEPFDGPGGTRVAVAADPQGAVFALMQPGELRGAQVVNEPGAWTMSLLATSDTEAAERFYGEVFGWERDAFGDFSLWRLPGFVGGEPMQPVPRDVIGAMMPAEGRAPGWDVNFWVHDADETAARAAELDGTVVVPPFDGPVTRDAVLADPQGGVFWVTTAPGP